MKKYIIALTGCIVIAAALLTVVACGPKKDASKLVVGMELQFPPFETTDEAGNPTGFSVDLANAIAAGIGRTAEIKNIAWAGLIPALESGEVDIVLSSMSVTEERKQSVDFTEPYGTWYIVTLLNSGTTITTFDELNDAKYTIALKIGTVAETIAADKLPNAVVQKFDTWEAAVLEVAQGKAHAAVYDPISVFEASQKYPDTTKAFYQPIQGYDSPVAGAVKKGNTELLQQVSDYLVTAKQDGTIAAISAKYLSDLNTQIAEQGAPPFFQ